MRQYELIVILSPELAEEDVPDAIDRLIRRPVEDRGGEISEVDNLGHRKLAYPIEKKSEGNYVLTQLRLDPQKTAELEQRLTISEQVMRHLLIRIEEEGT